MKRIRTYALIVMLTLAAFAGTGAAPPPANACATANGCPMGEEAPFPDGFYAGMAELRGVCRTMAMPDDGGNGGPCGPWWVVAFPGWEHAFQWYPDGHVELIERRRLEPIPSS
jgi:hypothetical protein